MANVWLDVVALWAVFLGTLVGILLVLELGYNLGRWRHRRTEREGESPVGVIVGAELGLLAFLLAVTFSLVAGRFDDRRQALLKETNAIGTCYLRAAMLPPDRRDDVCQLLREYVDVRLASVQQQSFEQGMRRSEELHGLLWAQAVAAAEADPRSVQAGLFVASLNDVIDLHAVRVQVGLRSRLPGTIWAVLFAVTALSFCGIGYHSGLSGTRRSPAVIAVALGFALVIWLVVDLDRPQEGMLRVSQQPLIDLQRSMTPPPPPPPPPPPQ